MFEKFAENVNIKFLVTSKFQISSFVGYMPEMERIVQLKPLNKDETLIMLELKAGRKITPNEKGVLQGL